MQLIPENLARLQATMFVENTELMAIGRETALRMAAERMAELGLRKILKDCIKTEGDYMGYSGQTLKLDVFVLSPSELEQIVVNARMKGEEDALRYGNRL